MTRLHRTPEGVIRECEAKSPETCKFGGMHFDISERRAAEKYNDIMNALAEGKLKEDSLPTGYYPNEDFLKLGPPIKAISEEAGDLKQENVKKTKEETTMTIEDALEIKARKDIDFNFIDNNHSNPNYFEDYKYCINCQTTVLAFELRCRGYDVEAKGNDSLETNYLSQYVESAYINPETGKHPERQSLEGANYKQLYKSLDEAVKPNERYILRVVWRDCRAGHVVNVYRNEEGEIILFDPQNNTVSKGEQIKEYFRNVRMRSHDYWDGYFYYTKLIRIDNTEIDPKVAKKVLIPHKTEDNRLDKEEKAEEKIAKANKPKKEKEENKPKSNVKLPEMLTKFATKEDLMTLQEEYSDKELNEMFKDIKDPVSFVNKMNELLGV